MKTKLRSAKRDSSKPAPVQSAKVPTPADSIATYQPRECDDPADLAPWVDTMDITSGNNLALHRTLAGKLVAFDTDGAGPDGKVGYHSARYITHAEACELFPKTGNRRNPAIVLAFHGITPPGQGSVTLQFCPGEWQRLEKTANTMLVSTGAPVPARAYARDAILRQLYRDSFGHHAEDLMHRALCRAKSFIVTCGKAAAASAAPVSSHPDTLHDVTYGAEMEIEDLLATLKEAQRGMEDYAHGRAPGESD